MVTLGAQSSYLDRYVTTHRGTRSTSPTTGSARPIEDRYATLRHELVHVRQFERWGVPMAVAYLLLPLPLGLAWFRMRFEREAYEETLRVSLRARRARRDRALRAHVIRQFTSGAYGWMWPFPRAMARWFDELVAALERGGAVARQRYAAGRDR